MTRPLTCALLAGLAGAGVFARVAEAGEASGPLVGHAFVVEVAISPKAQERLRAIGEKVKVLASFGSPPLAAHTSKAKEGEIALGPEEDVVLPLEGGTARFKGELSRAKLGWVATPRLLVNVVSARLKNPDNLLACGIFDDAIALAQQRPIAIKCRLISEE